jgi:hypothetical protein
MNSNSKKLSLKLPPEVAKIMPFIVSAKASGKTQLNEWAKQEYERALTEARMRERSEREAEVRRERIEWERRLIEEEQEREYLVWRQEQCVQEKRLEKLDAHWALDDGREEIQPTQSSQKGWRRMLSECVDLQDRHRYYMWGGKHDRYRSNQKSLCAIRGGKWKKQKGKHNNGRKPRKPWFKKTHARR